jgi:hypothetical protein
MVKRVWAPAMAASGLALLCGLGAAAPAPPALTQEKARALVEAMAQRIERSYVFPERRAGIAGALRRAREGSRYDTSDPRELARRLTEDLRAASHDRHLYVDFDLRSCGALPAGAGAPGGSEEARDPGRRRNHGFEEMRVLDGNVRYVRVTGFPWTKDSTSRVIDEVARFLGEGDAILVDLRGNGGQRRVRRASGELFLERRRSDSDDLLRRRERRDAGEPRPRRSSQPPAGRPAALRADRRRNRVRRGGVRL